MKVVQHFTANGIRQYVTFGVWLTAFWREYVHRYTYMYMYTIYLSIYLIRFWTVSTFLLFSIILLWTHMYKFLFKHVFSTLLALTVHMVTPYWTFRGTARLLCEVAAKLLSCQQCQSSRLTKSTPRLVTVYYVVTKWYCTPSTQEAEQRGSWVQD